MSQEKQQAKLDKQIEQGLASISKLETKMSNAKPGSKQEAKLQKEIDKKNNKISNLESKRDAFAAEKPNNRPRPRQTEPAERDPYSTKGTGELRDFEQPDVSDERMENVYGVTGFNDAEVQRLSQSADTQVERVESDTEALRRLGQQLLTGNIPVDVSEAVSRASASGALSRGITSGSQLGRNLTVRDLGMTSLDLMTKGGEVMGTTAQLSQSLAAFQESRAQYRTQFQLASAELRDAIRKTDLSVSQLAEEKHQFKQKMTLALNEQMIQLAMFREELQFKYASTDLQGDAGKAKGPLSTIDNLIGQLRTSLTL